MKRIIAFLLLISMALAVFSSCNSTENQSSQDITTSSQEETVPMIPDENAKLLWQSAYADNANGIPDADSVYKMTAYANGAVTDKYTLDSSTDNRILFEGASSTRAVVLSEGYAITLPGTGLAADFSLGALRSKYSCDDYVLTLSYENKNTYGANEHGFGIYMREWLVRYLDPQLSDMDVDGFYSSNSLSMTEPVVSTTDLKGFEVHYYNSKILQVSDKIKYDQYSIAVIRPVDSYEYFWLLVLKSVDPMDEQMKTMVASFKELKASEGVGDSAQPVNNVGSYELRIPDYWSEETKAYYNKLLNQTTVDWGAFFHQNTEEYIDWFTGEEGINTDMDIFMTYLHVGWYDEKTHLDEKLIQREAGGNGFNGKPVLNLTYQFTVTNNGLGGVTPMYDIMRGKYDFHFKKLARDIKAYGKPVLFRLNNEMNTDWTSYCGMQTMLDPDVFIETWRRLYNIFREEGVDNTIWIFNPIATSCPYSNWGDALNYFPGEDYVQMLGLTYYQMNNDDHIESFKEMYTELYNKNMPYFANYPAIIGEFACGAGAEVIYDWEQGGYVPVPDLEQKRQWQAQWITDMFECMANNQLEENAFCKNIKVAIWFSANDYATVDGESKIINYLKLDEGVPLAIQAFREGYQKLKDKRK